MKDNVTARCWAGRRSNECLFQPPWIFIFLWSRSWSRGRRWMLYTDWKYFIAASSSASLSTPELPPRPGHPYLIQLREEEKVFANTQRPRRRPELKEAYKIHRMIWLQVLALLWYWDWEEEKLLWHHEKLKIWRTFCVSRAKIIHFGSRFIYSLLGNMLFISLHVSTAKQSISLLQVKLVCKSKHPTMNNLKFFHARVEWLSGKCLRIYIIYEERHGLWGHMDMLM